MLFLPNFLSLLRIPCALVFLQSNPVLRIVGLFIAMISDWLDGFVARKFSLSSRMGTLLDPLMDKFFVFFVLSVMISEQKVTLLEACMLICRDFSVIIYGIYLALRGRLLNYQFRAIWCGKLTTMLQFFVLLGISFGIKFPPVTYSIFIILGILALGELYKTDRSRRLKSLNE